MDFTYFDGMFLGISRVLFDFWCCDGSVEAVDEW